MKPRVDVLDILTFCLCAAYSAFLEAADNKRRFEPDLVWAEVVVGNLIVLIPGPALRVRLQAERGDVPTWRDYEAATARAFIVGGLPVILWQLWQAMTRRERARNYLRGEHDEQRAEAVADSREWDS